jgi:hypothetical protein
MTACAWTKIKNFPNIKEKTNEHAIIWTLKQNIPYVLSNQNDKRNIYTCIL